MNRGVFWLINGKLFAFPFDGSHPEGIAKSGNTYNHQKLWDSVKPKGCRLPFDWYPRGRVELTKQNVPVIYMSPLIGAEWIPEIMTQFALRCEPVIRYDHSVHYHCYIDKENSHEI